MRPLRLTISGFTASRDEQIIDFEPLDLFAITGPTGSGKTTMLAAAVLTALLLLATAGAFDTSLTDFFATRSVPEAYGRNVVNVILVDFRALDTLGEITVVMLSFLAAWPLLQALRARRTATPKGGA